MHKKIIDIKNLTSEQKDFLLMVFATSEFLFNILQESLSGEMQLLVKNNNAYLSDTFNRSPNERDDLLQQYLTVDEDNADNSFPNHLESNNSQ